MQKSENNQEQESDEDQYGFSQTLSNGFNTLSQYISFGSVVSWSKALTYDLASFTLPAATAWTNAVTSWYQKPNFSHISGQGLKLIYDDFLPIMLIWGISQYLDKTFNQYLNPCYPDESCHYSMSMLMYLTSTAMRMVPATLSIKYHVDALAKNAVISARIGNRLDEDTQYVEARKPSKRLSEHTCRNCKGEEVDMQTTWELVDYYLILGLLNAGFYIPHVGSSFYHTFSVLLNGQYLLGKRLAEDGLCSLHRDKYFQEYFALSVFIGLCQELTTRLQIVAGELLLSKTVGDYSLASLYSPLCMLNAMGVLTMLFHMNIPKPSAHIKTKYPDPLYGLRYVLKEAILLLLPGLEIKIKNYFNKPGQRISISEEFTKIERRYDNLKKYQMAQMLLPKTLLNGKDFCNDAILKESLDVIRFMSKYVYELQAYTGLTLADVIQDLSRFSFLRAILHGSLIAAHKETGIMPQVLAYVSKYSPGMIMLANELLNDKNLIHELGLVMDKLQAFGATIDSVIIKCIKSALHSYSEENKSGNEGWHRANLYRRLFDAFNYSNSTKYLICLAIASNEKSPTLQKHIKEKIDAELGEDLLRHSDVALFNRFCNHMVESLINETKTDVEALSFSEKEQLKDKALSICAEINESCRHLSSIDEVDEKIKSLQTLIENWHYQSLKSIKATLNKENPWAAQKMVGYFGAKLKPDNIVVIRPQKKSLEKKDLIKEMNEVREKVQRALSDYTAKGLGWKAGRARVAYYNRLFQKVAMQPITDEQKVLAYTAISIAILGDDKAGANLKNCLATQLKTSHYEILSSKQILKSRFTAYYFSSDKMSVERSIFDDDFDQLLSDINDSANSGSADQNLKTHIAKLKSLVTLGKIEISAHSSSEASEQVQKQVEKEASAFYMG